MSGQPSSQLPDYPIIQSPTPKILLIRLRQIGDVVFTTPAIRAIRQKFPDAHITYVVEPASEPIVAGNRHLDRVVTLPRGRGLMGLVGDLDAGRQLRSERFDLAIDFHGGPRSSLLTWLSGATARIGYRIRGRSWMYTRVIDRPRALRARHSVENQWDLLAPLGIGPPDAVRFPVEMTLDEGADRSIHDRLSAAGIGLSHQLVVVHVSAGNPFRRWPAQSFVTLVSRLACSSDRRIVITSGPSDRDAAGQVIAGARGALGCAAAERVVSCGEFSLSELRALAARAALFIGGDSGPLHVAATTSVPVVGLYGPTLPARSAPWRNPGFPAEAVEVQGLACRPCDQRVCAPGDFRCLTSIGPDEVVAAAERLLSKTPSARRARPD